MELITDTACLLCKQQTTVLKLDNVKSYLDKLFDTFFDKSNIFKDEFQGMVANASLCLMCTPKVNICCNLRNDYEDKYNGKCLQKLLSASGCLLCDGNLTPLTNTQDMPSSLLQQIELFMNSTSFPETYSDSALCLTCIHSLNIWHEVRSSIMKLRQNDEVDENNGADECTNSDSTDISNSTKNVQLKSKKTKTKRSTLDESNVEKENVIDLVDSDAESVEKVDNQGKSATQISSKRTEKVASGDKMDDIQSKENLSDRSRSASPSLLNNKFGKKFRLQQKTQKLSLNKNVKDKKSLISDSSDSEIDGLNKIVEEIVESYENEEATLKMTPSNSSKVKKSGEQSISKIDDSSDGENQTNTTQKSLNVSPSKSTPSPRWISKRKSFMNISDSSDSESINEKKTKKLKRRRLSTFPKDNIDNEERRIDNSSDEERPQKNIRILNQSRLSVLSKGSPKPESPKRKLYDKENRQNTSKIDDSSDEEHPQKNTKEFNRSKLSTDLIESSESESSETKKSDNRDREKTTKLDDSFDEEQARKKNPKLNRSRASVLSKGSPEPESSKHKKSDKKTTEIHDSSDKVLPSKNTRKLNLSKLLNSSTDSSESESSKHKKSDNEDQEKTTTIDDSSDEERPQKNTQKLNQSKLSTFSKSNLKAQTPKHKRSDNSDRGKTAKIDDSDSSECSESEGSKHKISGNEDREKTTKIDDSSGEEEHPQNNSQKLNQLKLSTFSKSNLKVQTPKHKRSDNSDQGKTTKIDDSDSSECSESEGSKHKKSGNEDQEKTTKIDDSSGEEEHPQNNSQKLNQSNLSTSSKSNLKAQTPKHKRSDNGDRGKTTEIDDSDSSNEEHSRKNSKKPETFSDDEIIKEGNKRKLKTQECKKSKNKEQISESEIVSDTENTQNSKHKRRSTRLEAQTTIIDDSSDNESNHAPSLQKDRKSPESKTQKMDDSSDSESTGTDSTEKLKGFENRSKADNRKSDSNSESETTSESSSDTDSSKTITSNRKNKKISSEAKKSRDEASRTSDSSDEFESKNTARKRSLRKFPSPPKIVLSDSSDQENMNTSPSKSRTITKSKINKKHDSLWLYLNKRLNKLQSVKKLHQNKNINLPDARLDDKFYNQLPYVLLEKDKVQNTKTVKQKVVSKGFPKLKLKLRKVEPVKKEDERRTSRRINQSPITITLSDDESQDEMNSSFVEIQTLCCPICDKISKTFSECKAHDLFHEKPEQVVINVVRENLKQLQKKYYSSVSKKIDNIMSKYLNVSKSSVSEVQETISNGHSSGSGSVEFEDEELKLVEDSTSSKSHIPLPNEKSSSTSEDNSDCENVPNIVKEKKRKLSILLNNSRDKSDNSSPNPKRVRFALDHKTSLPNAQSTEDLTKTKLKRSCALI